MILTAILIYLMLAVTTDILQIPIDNSSISKYRLVTSDSDIEPRSHNNIQADYSIVSSQDKPELADARSVSAFLFDESHSHSPVRAVKMHLIVAEAQVKESFHLGDSPFESICLGCAYPEMPEADHLIRVNAEP